MNPELSFEEAFYLPSGRVFLLRTAEGYPIECTEMRDVSVEGKEHAEVRVSLDPHVVWRHLRPYADKWLLTVSTQRGCVHNCNFCDVAPLPFRGNLSQAEIEAQVRFLLAASPYVTASAKVKIGFARMGEPAHNLEAVLGAMARLPEIGAEMGRQFAWLPCFNSILPRKVMGGLSGFEVIERVIAAKEERFGGRLHFQISANSTDEDTRRALFGGAEVLSLAEIISTIKGLGVTGRTVTLNFIVMKGVPVEVDRLLALGLDPAVFAVKLIPLNATEQARDHALESVANYNNVEDLTALGARFAAAGIPVVTDAIAKCEEAGLCCGQLAHIFIPDIARAQ